MHVVGETHTTKQMRKGPIGKDWFLIHVYRYDIFDITWYNLRKLVCVIMKTSECIFDFYLVRTFEIDYVWTDSTNWSILLDSYNRCIIEWTTPYTRNTSKINLDISNYGNCV